MTISDYKDAFKGSNEPAIIIGKGPSLDRLDEVADQVRSGIVFACNEAIHKAEWFTSRAFCVQQDSELGGRCVPTGIGSVHLMSCYQCKLIDGLPRKVKVESSEYNSKAVLYDPYDFGESISSLTAVMACKLAAYMGLIRAIFLCFDSATTGSEEYAKCIGNNGNPDGRHRTNWSAIAWAAKTCFKDGYSVRGF